MSFQYRSPARRSGEIAPLFLRLTVGVFAAIAALFLLPFRPGTTGAAMDEFCLARHGLRGRSGGLQVDPDGVSYMTGIGGPSPNTDILTSSFNPDGSLRWSQTWNSVALGADQSRAITKSASGIIYVAG